ncbi:MAG: WD40 repeat domain-containing protein [Promethearchaeota archaeon]
METRSFESRISKKDKNEKISSEAKVSKKAIQTVLSQHKLEVRDIEISPDGKFLISCSECEENEDPHLIVWNIDELLEGETKPEIILQAEKKKHELVRVTNWLLCIDSTVVEKGNVKWWIICAGSIIGDIYIWSFKLPQGSRKWDFENYKSNILSGGSEDPKQYPKSIFDIKIQEDPNQNDLLHIYYTLNNIHTTIWKEKTHDNTLNEIEVTIGDSGLVSKNGEIHAIGTNDVWITKIMINRWVKEDIIISGSKDGKVKLWNITAGTDSVLIGEHDGAITDISISRNGKWIATSSTDAVINIWERNIENLFNKKKELIGHTEAVLAIDLQTDENYLISASKDNTIKIWDLSEFNWIRSIDLGHYIDLYEEKNIIKEIQVKGLNFVKNIKVTPDNRYIIVSKYNKILVLRNFGGVWHFIQQLKFIKKNDPELYRKIYGDNLKQFAKYSPENVDTLNELYNIIKKRLIKVRKIELASKTEQKIEYDMRELGSFFIPSFMNFESKLKSQKEFMLGVKQNYTAYWNSIRNSIFKLPDIPWSFNLYLTTSEMGEKIEDSNFVEITTQSRELPYIILKDRTQTQIRFLMVLNRVQTSFIPLLNNITIDIEDDRGDKDTLMFSDFTYSKNFLRILTNPTRSLDKVKEIKKPESIYYADCTFQIDEGYSVEDFANIFIRKITVEYTETLEPSESTTSNQDDFKIIEAFKNNFIYPLTPKTKVQIGKGLKSKLGKMIDEYFAKIIIIEFILSFWGFIEEGLTSLEIDETMLNMISTIVNVASIGIIVIIFIMMIVQSRSGKKRDIDIDELDEKMRKRRRKKFGK